MVYRALCKLICIWEDVQKFVVKVDPQKEIHCLLAIIVRSYQKSCPMMLHLSNPKVKATVKFWKATWIACHIAI